MHRRGDGRVPTGPYVDHSGQPVVCDNGVDTAPTIDAADYGGSIDPDIFTDHAGNSFLLWKSDGNHSVHRPSSGPCR